MTIPESIKKLANDIRTKVYGREVREALASGIEAAGSIANDADVRSQETETKQTSLEKKYDEQIANMSLENPNVAEVVDARVSGYDGQSYTTIGKRFDSVDAQLAQNTSEVATISDKMNALQYDKASQSELISVNERISKIITTPAESVSAQEIIDARDGENSLGDNIRKIKHQGGSGFNNLVKNGNFINDSNWTAFNSDLTFDGTLIMMGNGTYNVTRVKQDVGGGYLPKHKIYLRLNMQTNHNLNSMGIALYKTGIDESTEVVERRIYFPVVGKNYLLNDIVELPIVDGESDSLSVEIRAIYSDSESSNGRTIQADRLVLLDLTKIFGVGNEPALDAVNEFIESLPDKWVDYDEKSSKIEKGFFNYKANKSDILEVKTKIDTLHEKTFEEINRLPVNRNKYDSNLKTMKVFENHQEAYIKVNASTDVIVRYNQKPTVLLTSINATDAYVYYDMGSILDFSNKDFIDIHLHVDDINNLNNLQIDLLTGSDLLNRFSYYYAANDLKLVKENGWRFLRIPKRKFVSAQGTPDWTKIRYFRVFVRSVDGTSIKVNLAKMETGSLQKGAISFYFDDATIGQYENAFPIMEKYGFVGTIACPTNDIGKEGYVTWRMLREMHNAGWLVVSHGHTQRSLATLSEVEIREEIETSSRILFERGFHFGSKCIVAPQGSWSDTVDRIAREYLVCCRNYNYGGDNRVTPSMEFPQSHPRYQQYLSPYSTDSVATMQGWIDNVIAKKEEFSFAWHIIETPAPNQWSNTVEDFEAVIAYARQKVDEGVLDVVTWKDTMIQTPSPQPIDSNGKQYFISKNGKPAILTLPIS